MAEKKTLPNATNSTAVVAPIKQSIRLKNRSAASSKISIENTIPEGSQKCSGSKTRVAPKKVTPKASTTKAVAAPQTPTSKVVKRLSTSDSSVKQTCGSVAVLTEKPLKQNMMVAPAEPRKSSNSAVQRRTK